MMIMRSEINKLSAERTLIQSFVGGIQCTRMLKQRKKSTNGQRNILLLMKQMNKTKWMDSGDNKNTIAIMV